MISSLNWKSYIPCLLKEIEKLNFWIKFKWKGRQEVFKEHNSINLNFLLCTMFLQCYTRLFWLYACVISYVWVTSKKHAPFRKPIQVYTYLIRSGRRSTTFGCECFLAFDGVNPTVQANINSVESSTGIWGDFSSGSFNVMVFRKRKKNYVIWRVLWLGFIIYL